MRNHSCRIAVVLALTLGLVESSRVSADVFSPAQMNAVALETAMAMDTSMLVQNFDAQRDVLSYTGTFSDLGWTALLTGIYAGLPLSVSFTGLFDPALQSGTFTSVGTLGNGGYNGSGSWSFASLTPDSSHMNWDEDVTLGLNPPPGPPPVKGPFPDRHTTILFVRTATETTSSGEIVFTLGGDRIGSEEVFDSRIEIPGPQWRSSIEIGDGVRLAGQADFATATASGTLEVVPEPSTLVMLTAGMVALLRRRTE